MDNNIQPNNTYSEEKPESISSEQEMNSTQKIIATSVITAIITSLIVGAGFLSYAKNHPGVLEGSIGRSSNNHVVSQSENAVVDAVKKANPAVVAITISKNVPTYERYYENSPDPFGGLFGLRVPQVRQNGSELQEVGGGSGFLVSSDGYIVTNKHVVADEAAQYTVFTNDGKKYEAKVVGRDPSLDLAVIKIEGSGFTSLNFADSDKVEVGQTAIAIGNALAEFRNTVSVGIVSGLARSITASDGRGSSESLDQLIQTDAGINPGNSGGPLLDLSGDVIGVNVAVASDANSIGFALSANSVKNVVESVKKTGKIVRPFLGVRYTPVTTELKQQNKLTVDYGVLITGDDSSGNPAVVAGSPADKAGLKANDIILEIDGQKLDEKNQLQSIIGKKKVGDQVTLKVLSGGAKKTVNVTLEQM